MHGYPENMRDAVAKREKMLEFAARFGIGLRNFRKLRRNLDMGER
jgi:hypothetical protein